jgi:hypothetical protein
MQLIQPMRYNTELANQTRKPNCHKPNPAGVAFNGGRMLRYRAD